MRTRFGSQTRLAPLLGLLMVAACVLAAATFVSTKAFAPRSADATGVNAAQTPDQLRALDAAERGLIGKLNDDRTARGLGRLRISLPLTNAASDYAEYLRATNSFDHGLDGKNSMTRAQAAGWPQQASYTVYENLHLGGNETDALNGWETSPSHAESMFRATSTTVGLGHSGDRWVILLGGDCAAPECGVTADTGDSSLFGREQDEVTKPATARLAPKLKTAMSRRGRTLKVRIRITKGAGRVKLCVRHTRRGGCVKRARRARHGKLSTYKMRLPRAGRYKVAVRLTGSRGWKNKVVRLKSFSVRR